SGRQGQEDPLWPSRRDCRHLIHDRDPLFTDAFRAILSDVGVESLKHDWKRSPAKAEEICVVG
ncbi:MAG: hypothetical protein ACJASX_003113, partial [Limisphaerales bacterium]